MSALWTPVAAPVEPSPAVDGERRPFLRAVPGLRPRLSRTPFILVLIAIFAVGMTGLLMLNTTLQSQAFQARALSNQATQLTYTQADLESQVDQLAAPQELARRASALGLRPNPYPAFLVLPKGKVVGTPHAVGGHEVPSMVLKTPAQEAAARAAAARRKAAREAERVAEVRSQALQAQVDSLSKAARAKVKEAAARTAAATAPASTKGAAKRSGPDKSSSEKSSSKKSGTTTTGRG